MDVDNPRGGSGHCDRQRDVDEEVGVLDNVTLERKRRRFPWSANGANSAGFSDKAVL